MYRKENNKQLNKIRIKSNRSLSVVFVTYIIITNIYFIFRIIPLKPNGFYANRDLLRHNNIDEVTSIVDMINNAYTINVIEYRRDNHKMDNPEKMATQDTNKQTKSQHNMC